MLMAWEPIYSEKSKKNIDKRGLGLSRLLLMRSHHSTVPLAAGELTKSHSTGLIPRDFLPTFARKVLPSKYFI